MKTKSKVGGRKNIQNLIIFMDQFDNRIKKKKYLGFIKWNKNGFLFVIWN